VQRSCFLRAGACALITVLLVVAGSSLAEAACAQETAVAGAQHKELQVAAAADLQPVIPALAAAYERASGVRLVTSFGSSATLAQQLANGAPQDVFLSADTVHPQQLIDAGVAEGPAPVEYARGVLVLWARKDSPAQPLTMESLKSARVTRIAIANAQHAPYGLAAVEALRALKMYDELQPKFAIAENIAQTAQFAESGNAQAGLISLTIASSPHFRELGSFIRVPAVYAPIRQAGMVMKSSKQQELAREFLRWLTSKPTQAMLPGFGLDPAK
jgi:molybdate transport system substrate-binding protein